LFHADPRLVRQPAGLGPVQVKQELMLASSDANPSQLVHDLAFPHMTVLVGPDFHGNHCVED